MRYISRFALIGLIFVFSTSAAFSANQKIMSWGIDGNKGTPAYVNEIRLGCPPIPKYCIDKLKAYTQLDIRLFSLAIDWKSLDYENLGQQIKSYLELLKNRKGTAIEISIDDFETFLGKFGAPKTSNIFSLLQPSKAKIGYSIGVTIYEDDLDRFEARGLTPTVTAAVDRVALYLHHRSSYVDIKQYIRKLRHFFPVAQIYLGVYLYDRSDYVNCSRTGRVHCTEDEDIDLFRKALLVQVNMLGSGEIDGLELYPGYFGREESWAGWSNPRICSLNRTASCVKNSKIMSDIVTQQLSKPLPNN
jgi:hypothetical protein